MRQSHSNLEEICDELICEINNQNEDEVNDILKKNPRLNLQEVLDERLFSTLHLTTFSDNLNITSTLLKYAKEQNDKQYFDEYYLKNFIDMRNDEGFSAMHLAAYRGNLQIVQLLESYGASLYIKNATGLTPMHTAAQGDNPHILAYLREKRMDFDQIDSSGRSPLHWASYQGSEQSAIFLISWGANILRQDQEIGMTPLHLAALSGSVRLTRKLLLRGANRDEVDFQGKKALDIARENDFTTISKMLEEKNRFKQCLSMKQELRPPQIVVRQFWFFIISQIVCNLFTILFVAPYFEQKAWLYAQVALFTLVMLMLILARTDPGYLKPKNNQQRILPVLLKLKDFDEFCPDCEIVKPPRSRHCESCRQCVKVYDHHCPWIGNCVGAENYLYFFIFIIIVFVQLSFEIILHVLHIYDLQVVPENQYIVISDSKDTLEFMHILSSAICLTLCLLFIVPLLMLLWVQIQNLTSGLTTNERFSRKKGRNGGRHNSPSPSGVRQSLTGSGNQSSMLLEQGQQSSTDLSAGDERPPQKSATSSTDHARLSIPFSSRKSVRDSYQSISGARGADEGAGKSPPHAHASRSANRPSPISINGTGSESAKGSSQEGINLANGSSINSQGDDYDDHERGSKAYKNYSRQSSNQNHQTELVRTDTRKSSADTENNKEPLLHKLSLNTSEQSDSAATGRYSAATAQHPGASGGPFHAHEFKSRCTNIFDMCCRNATNYEYSKTTL